MSVVLPGPVVGFTSREAWRATRSRPDLRDDARQEGLAAVWQLLRDKPTSSPELQATAARRAIIRFTTGRRAPLGSETFGSGASVPTCSPGDEVVAREVAPVGGVADLAMWAAHRDEIEDAVAALPPSYRRAARKIMAAEPLTKADRQAFRQARPRLAEQLSHLKGMIE